MSKILVVDDDDALREYVTRFLDRRGFEVRDVGTLAEAEAAYRAFAPDLLVLDWRLEADDGVEFARQLSSEHAGVRVVLMTGYVATDFDWGGYDAFLLEVLKKPFELGELADAVGRALAVSN